MFVIEPIGERIFRVHLDRKLIGTFEHMGGMFPAVATTPAYDALSQEQRDEMNRQLLTKVAR
jgi:hypothetical protein